MSANYSDRPVTQMDLDLLRQEMREGFKQINARLDKQNGRIGKTELRVEKVEKDVLILVHDKSQDEREATEQRADARQDKLIKELYKMFNEYVRPAVTMGGILYLIAKSAGWIP